MANVEQVIIVGSGPAGYTAALYTARANLNPLVIEGFLWGGLLQQTTDVENYPGYPEGIMGPEMMQQFRDQAERFGTRFITDNVDQDRAGRRRRAAHRVGRRRRLPRPHGDPRDGRRAQEAGRAGRGGARRPRRLLLRDLRRRVLQGPTTIIVGGGDSAMEEAIFLAKFSSKVTIVNRRDEFRASTIMLDRAREHENIEFLTPYVVEEFAPDETACWVSRSCATPRRARQRELADRGAFIAIGHEPQSELVQGIVETDENGYVVTEGKSTRTDVPGIFAAGDLVDHTYRQAVTAAGSGCQAALDAEWYLRDNPTVPTPAALEGTGDLAEAQWAHPTPAS